jgi:cytochrome P450
MAVSPVPPGPRGRLLTGNLKEFFHDRLAFFTACARRHGDLSSFRLGPRRAYLAAHPDLIERVLVTDSRLYRKHFGVRLYEPVLGNGLVSSEGDLWLRQRRLMQPAFHRTRLLGYAAVMVALAEEMLAGWRPGQLRNIHTDMARLTSAIALKTLFDLDAGEDRDAYADALRQAFLLLGARFRWPVRMPLWLPTPNNLRLRRALGRLDALVAGFIREGRRRPPGNDLLSLLLHARDEDGSRMSDRQLRDEAMTLYLAGHETTALALSWTWYLLARHPEVEEELAAEWRRVLEGRPPTPDDLPRLPLTEWVIAEAMRLYPPAYLIGREATADVELGGYRVPRRTTVFLCQWVTHRDGRFFPDPDRFAPHRWADDLAGRLPRYAYFPFGGGPRVCLGHGFALMEAALLLACLGQRWRFTLEPEPAVKIRPGITLLPEPGIPAVLRPRPV